MWEIKQTVMGGLGLGFWFEYGLIFFYSAWWIIMIVFTSCYKLSEIICLLLCYV